MADFLDEKRSEIAARLNELKPLVDEYARLQAAADALDGVGATASSPSPLARSRARGVTAPTKARVSADTIRRGRPPGSGARAAQALAVITASPGIRVADIAEQMGIRQNYVYALVRRMAADGLVRKHDDRGWHPSDHASA